MSDQEIQLPNKVESGEPDVLILVENAVGVPSPALKRLILAATPKPHGQKRWCGLQVQYRTLDDLFQHVGSHCVRSEARILKPTTEGDDDAVQVLLEGRLLTPSKWLGGMMRFLSPLPPLDAESASSEEPSGPRQHRRRAAAVA
jgi:hypothetical protein